MTEEDRMDALISMMAAQLYVAERDRLGHLPQEVFEAAMAKAAFDLYSAVVRQRQQWTKNL